ncbi:MAG: trypsin-like peptidase domain-containing protein [Vicinamibacteria bacterium]
MLGASFQVAILLALTSTPVFSQPDLQKLILEARDRVSPALVNVQPITDVYSSGERRSSTGVGSGFIFDDRGHVITNYHVAGRAKRLIITLSNRERVAGVLVGEDPLTDIAVLKLELRENQKIPAPVSLGDSDSLAVGHYVMALGSPLALQRSLSFGVVSSKDRYLSDEMKLPTGEKTGSFNTWIQTDAAINPGNSGGPLVNLEGEVVGVNSRGAFGASSIGFAIPINIVKDVARELIEKGKVSRSWLGLTLQPLEELAQYFESERLSGVVIRSVDPDSPAERAGVRAGDVLLSFDGRKVSARFMEELPSIYKRFADTPIGEKVELVVTRAGEELTVEATTEEQGESTSGEMDCGSWGFTARGITRELALEFSLPDPSGVFVAGVKPNGAAFQARLFPGDRIIAVGAEPVSDLEDLQSIYRASNEARTEEVLLTVMRRHSRRWILIEAAYED